jgi:excisionase family DNA binding protein
MHPPERGQGTDIEMLAAKEVAALLGISVRTVWRLRARGELPQPIRYSRKLVRWRRDHLERFLEARLMQPTGGTT